MTTSPQDSQEAPKMPPRYASLSDAASYLGGINIRTLRRMIARKAIKAYRLPGSRLLRVDLTEIDALMIPEE